MTPSTAREIVGSCVRQGLAWEGLFEDLEADRKLISECSLAELMEANELVRMFNEAPPPKADGSTSHTVICADRLIAALYVAANFSADAGVVATCGNRIVVVCDKSDLRRNDGDEEEG